MTKHPSHKMEAAKRAKLFDVSIREFVTHGFTQASLNRIIAEIGMSKSSFYHYFANKTELFQQILEQSLVPLTSLLTVIDLDQMSKETFWPSVKGAGNNAAGMFIENPQIILLGRMFFKSRATIKEAGLTSGFMEAIQEFILALLHRGQELGVIRTDLPDSYLINCIMALGMSMDQWVLENFHTIPQNEFAKLNALSMDLFIRILEPKEHNDQIT